MNPERSSGNDLDRLHESSLARRDAELQARERLLEQREHELRRRGAADAAVAQHNTDLRLANEKLVLATLAADELREQAQLMRRRQDEFLAMLAHELRNPLAPIRTAVEVIEKLNGREPPTRMLDIVRRQVHHMVRMLDDLLDVSRVTQGKVTLCRRSLALTEFIDPAMASCEKLIATRGHALKVELPPEAMHVYGDPVRLTQVFANLLDNAAKYCEEAGVISLTVAARGSVVELRVRDNGTGISAAALPHVFDLFAQDERALSRAQGGLGIGLTIVKKMVELHGGSIEARSEGRDRGSEFVVTLPRAAKPAGLPAGLPANLTVDLTVDQRVNLPSVPAQGGVAAAGAARVLVIDDNQAASETLAELLRYSGHEVSVALDGPSGLKLFDQLGPQVVLCDIGLPGMDGYEVVAQMHARRQAPPPLIIALTGYGGPQDGRRALEAGFDHHVVKPASPQALLQLIDTAPRRAEPG